MDTARARRPYRRALVVLVACLGLVVAACGGPNGLRSDTSGPSQAVGSSATAPVPEPAAGETTDSARSDSGTQGGEFGSATPPYVPADSRDAVDKRLAVTLGGRTTYIRNGGQILLSDGLAAEIFLDPYPPSALRSTMDVYLTRDGRALADGGVEVAYDMLAMGHGSVSAEAQNIGGGHYLLPLDYIMFGPWEQIVTIRIGLQRIRLPIIVVAYP